MNVFNKNKGITLVALVVTIVVLLILAGVSINLVIGQNGLITKAKEAKEKTEHAAKDEERMFNEIEQSMTEYLEPWSGNIASSFASGDGTEANPYIIENGEQLAYLASKVNAGEKYSGKYISITQSINLGGKEFAPIGRNIEETDVNNLQTYFDGTLDGKENTITGVKITQTDVDGIGIVGVLGENGTIKNLNTYEGTVIGKYLVGGIVGLNYGKIENCSNNLKITANYQAGGIVGRNNAGTVAECSNSGIITADKANAGGIAGDQENGTITGCSNSGEIIAKDHQAGGIAGALGAGTVENCSNNGTITANNQIAGGIAGYQVAGTIENCSNNGTIIANNKFAGGIVGYQKDETITGCSNNGTITANNQLAGGITGWQDAGTITGCNNSGEVTSSIGAGGISGYQVAGTIENCSNNGIITVNSQQAGGIAGRQVGGTIKNCANASFIIAKAETNRGIAGGIIASQAGGETYNVYNSGNVTTANFSDSTVDAIGGIVGYQKAGTISKAYNKGELTGGEATGGIIGQKNLAPEVSETYYYTSQDIKGIGSETDTNTEVTAVEDVQGKTEKTSKNIESLQSFLTATMP